MKKFLAIVAIASFAVACNNSSEKTETTDSVTVDSIVPAPVVVDSPVTTPTDTTGKMDTTKKM